MQIGPDTSGGNRALAALSGGMAYGLALLTSVFPLLAIPPLLAFAFLAWRSPGVPVMRRDAYKGGPLYHLKTGGHDDQILFPAHLLHDAVHGLRAHRRVPSRRIDPRATVAATIRRAGQPVDKRGIGTLLAG